jgi:hypothetical protein
VIPKVMALGDSHCRFFAGLEPEIVTYHFGPALAWSLASPVSRTEARARARLALGDLPPETWALFCFGEIDIRCHMFKPNYFGPDVCAERYLNGIIAMRPLHSRLAIWAPTATQPWNMPDDADYPTVGTEMQRNAATAEFTECLRRECAVLQIPVISILDLMVDERHMTRPETLADGRHAHSSLRHEALVRLRAALAL